jgi:hypothetical protein
MEATALPRPASGMEIAPTATSTDFLGKMRVNSPGGRESARTPTVRVCGSCMGGGRRMWWLTALVAAGGRQFSRCGFASTTAFGRAEIVRD